MTDSSEITFAKLTYKVVLGVGDLPSDLDKHPNFIGVTGTWTLRPEVDRLLLGDAEVPVTIVPVTIQGTFVDGRMTYNEDPYVYVILSPRSGTGAPLFKWRFSCEYVCRDEAGFIFYRANDQFPIDPIGDSDLTILRP